MFLNASFITKSYIAIASGRISSFQFGFTKNRCTVHQLLLSINHIFSSFGQKAQTDVIYLDFRKAFDSVPHNELLLKLWHFGITGILWLWFKAYLTSRNQLVSVNHCFSTTLPVLSGVPQGSILGPLLFLICVNDLHLSASSSSLLLFADDTKCFNMVLSPSDSLVLQQDLTSLFNWSNHWRLSFNELKCILIRFSASCPAINISYFLNQHQLLVTNSHKDLGIIVSSNLDWIDHYNYISGQAYKIFGLLHRTFSNCNSTHAKNSYLSLVRPKLTYCSCVRRPHLIKDITTLENVQRRATKFILNDYTSDYKSRLLKLDMFPLMLFYEYYDIIFFFKCLKSPSYAFDITKFVSFSSTSTRFSANFKLYHSKSSTNNCRHFYFNRLPRLWNSLPVYFSRSTTLLLQAPTQECSMVKIQISLRCQQSILFSLSVPM